MVVLIARIRIETWNGRAYWTGGDSVIGTPFIHDSRAFYKFIVTNNYHGVTVNNSPLSVIVAVFVAA